MPVREELRQSRNREAAILIVDDDPLARRLMQFVLEAGGYHVHSAVDARAAMRHLEDGGRPQLIVSDVMMPQILGTDFVQMLADQPDLAHIPVILASAAHDLLPKLKTAACVAKPFAPERLLELIRELLAEPDPPINVLREPRRLL